MDDELYLHRRILAGDATAWRAVYDDCFDALWAHTYRRVGGHRQRAEDVVQETWLVAVARVRSFDPQRGGFTAWLRGIADNVLRNRQRRWARRDGATRRELDERSDARARDPAAHHEMRELIGASWARLPPRYQDVLRAKYVDELSVVEIATQRGETAKAIESLLSRARGAFRDAYSLLDTPDSKIDGRGLTKKP